ncbi:MAG: cation-translocating P-type ATPase [Selenomonadaceae bacterium]|nr:cation-translocating P-type ATPase [Selenomonadaceae bacterium]
MKIKLFLLADILVTIIITTYIYFTKDIDTAIEAGLALFIAFSPIALILASAFVLQIARGVLEKEGVKVNRLKSLAVIPEVDTVAVPLNRFLMDGDYFVTDLVPMGLSQPSLLGVAATAEQKSEHPLGRVIYKTAAGRGLKITNVTSSSEFPGEGIEVIANGSTIRVGDPEWISSQNVSVGNALLTKIDKLSVYGKTVLVLSIGRMARGIIALKDAINQDAKEFLMLLKRKKFITVLLTASGKKTARSLAKNFNLDTIKTNLTPTDKAREITLMRAQGHTVAAVTNEKPDMPALAAADVSIFLQQQNLPSLIEEDEIGNGRAGSHLADIKAELEKMKFGDDDEKVEDDNEETPPAEETNDVKDYEADIEIPKLEKFFTVRTATLRAAELMKTNKNIAYFSWLVMVPVAIMNALPEPPFYFNPIIAVGGVSIFSVLILLNSLRMRGKISNE